MPEAGGARRFDSGCGAVSVAGVPARVTGTVATLDGGTPPAAPWLRSGDASRRRVERVIGAGPRSSAPIRCASRRRRREPVATAALPRVTDPGEGWNGDRDGVRLALSDGPAWLVLAESWSKGWHAYCAARNGDERDLGRTRRRSTASRRAGAPRRTAPRARFAFAPQRLANGRLRALVAAVAAMLAFMLVAVLRRRSGSDTRVRPPSKSPQAPADADADPLVRLPWRFALAAGLAIALAGGFLFALRAGAVLGPLAVLALRAGVSVRRLLLVAASCIAALPLIYLVFPARDRGGNEFGYPNDLVGAHWVALLAVLCLLSAGVLLAGRLRRASASGSRSST